MDFLVWYVERKLDFVEVYRGLKLNVMAEYGGKSFFYVWWCIKGKLIFMEGYGGKISKMEEGFFINRVDWRKKMDIYGRVSRKDIYHCGLVLMKDIDTHGLVWWKKFYSFPLVYLLRHWGRRFEFIKLYGGRKINGEV